jgi:microsomal dipeptidase-like Zn-dependent dipeptidase
VYDHPRNLSDEQACAIAGGGWIGSPCAPFVGEPPPGGLLTTRSTSCGGRRGPRRVGSDYDGFGLAAWGQLHDLRDVTYLPRLTEGLLRRDPPERAGEKVLGESLCACCRVGPIVTRDAAV